MTLGDFTGQASAYVRARPGYPLALVERLLADSPTEPDAPVVDLGAGTGIFTRLLIERGLRVTAVEPNAGMRAEAVAMAGVRWVDGTFEQTNLPAASQQWAVAAQAFHWADPQRALPEVRRILVPHGSFTVLWNNRRNQHSEVLQWTLAAIARHVPEFDQAYRDQSWAEVLTSTGDFVDVRHQFMDHTVDMSAARYLDLWRSHNRLNSTGGPERCAALFEELQDYLAARGRRSITVPYRCDAWTCRAR